MKKRDIIKLINANKIINKNDKVLANIEDRSYFHQYRKSEESWFPNIPELNEYFDILKNEIKESISETEKAKQEIKDTTCDHSVRLKYYGTFSCTNKCIFCGHNTSSNNQISFKESDNRNKHTVTFTSKYQSSDYDGENYTVDYGYTDEEIYEYILQILGNFKDEDEVDLVEEFSKLNIPNMYLNKEKRKKEKYLLIIAGTNKEYISDSTYISNNYDLKVEDYYNYFISMLNTKVAIIDNSFTFDKFSSKVKVKNYDTLDALNKSIDSLKDVDFDIVVDLTKLYQYEIVDNEFLAKKYVLPLNELFPKSNIFTINENVKVEENCNNIKLQLSK